MIASNLSVFIPIINIPHFYDISLSGFEGDFHLRLVRGALMIEP